MKYKFYHILSYPSNIIFILKFNMDESKLMITHKYRGLFVAFFDK